MFTVEIAVHYQHGGLIARHVTDNDRDLREPCLLRGAHTSVPGDHFVVAGDRFMRTDKHRLLNTIVMDAYRQFIHFRVIQHLVRVPLKGMDLVDLNICYFH